MSRTVLVEVLALSLLGGELHWEACREALPDGVDADAAARRLARLPEPAVDLVLHSTSWRTDGTDLVLTYAVFPAVPGPTARPLGRHLVTGPGPLQPTPVHCAQEHVAAHAVRHLADLAADRDPHVGACALRRAREWGVLRAHAARVHVDRVPVPARAGGAGVLTTYEHGAEHGAVDGLEDFVAACTEQDHHAPFEEHTLLTLDGARQLPHARIATHDGQGLAACAVLSEGVEGWMVELAVRPDARGRGLAGELLDQAVAHVAGHGGGTVQAWVHGSAPAASALARRRGARLGRRLLVLTRPLTGPELPLVGPATRPLDVRDDADRDAWLALSNAAFEGHPENGGWSRSDLDWRMQSDWTDGRRFPVVGDDVGLLAGVWTKVPPGSRTGELHVVAVHPRAQGRGLGRGVVVQALHDLRRAGCDRAELYVDADNAAGRRLYAWAGFQPGTEHRCLALDVVGRGAG
jgi:mycothiol synthase